jgi:hypothetical protein
VVEAMMTCKYGIADISFRTHNVPFELGLLLSYGRHTMVFDRVPHRYQLRLSDIQYRDPQVHFRDPERLIQKLSNWISQEVSEAKGTKVTVKQALEIVLLIKEVKRRKKLTLDQALDATGAYLERRRSRSLQQIEAALRVS